MFQRTLMRRITLIVAVGVTLAMIVTQIVLQFARF